MNISGNSMRIPNEVILTGNEFLGPHDNEFGKHGDDKNEGPPRPRIGDTVSIHLAQQPNSAAVWTLTVYVQIAQGFFQLGAVIVTNPPNPGGLLVGDPPARTVAFAACPGTIGWKVLATCPTNGENADLVIQSREGGGGASTFGVTPNIFVPAG